MESTKDTEETTKIFKTWIVLEKYEDLNDSLSSLFCIILLLEPHQQNQSQVSLISEIKYYMHI